MPELAVQRSGDDTAELRRHRLHSVADAENGHAEVEDGVRYPRRPTFRHGFRAAGQDCPLRRETADGIVAEVERVDLAVDALLAHAAGYELGVLRAEVDDQDAVAKSRRLRHVSRPDSSEVPW